MPEVFESAGEDEDVVTGDFGGLIRRGPVRVTVDSKEGGGVWKWAITYKKIRGRGAGATEKYVGADGVWEFVLDHGGREAQRKSALFQAKMAGDGGPKLFAQSIALSTWREAAFVIEYAPDSVFGLYLDDVVAARGKALAMTARIPFVDFLLDHFIACKVGDRDLYYDRNTRRLFWRDANNDLVVARFRSKHAFKVTVTPPWHFDVASPRPDREVLPSEIHNHRMQARPHDILGVPSTATKAELTRARKHLAQLYHPDTAGSLNDQIRAAMNRRMAETNAAYDKATGKNSRRGR
jgi:hypothetical protein